MTNAPDLPASCAALAAQLIVEGCLPMIEGNVKGNTSAKPIILSDPEREKLGLKSEGPTLFYPAGQDGVFFDVGRSDFTVWFRGDDYEKATAALHDALMQAFPTANQLDDVADALDSRMRARVYRVALSEGRIAAIETSFARSQSGKHKFIAHIIAQQRKS